MAVKEMLMFGYKLGQGLRAIGCGSPALIELLGNKGIFGLGYEPIHKELFQASKGKKRKCDTSGISISHIITTFSALAKVIMLEPFKELEDEEPDLACIIRLCPKEFSMNATIYPNDNPTSTTRLGMPGEATSLWTIKPCFVVTSVVQNFYCHFGLANRGFRGYFGHFYISRIFRSFLGSKHISVIF